MHGIAEDEATIVAPREDTDAAVAVACAVHSDAMHFDARAPSIQDVQGTPTFFTNGIRHNGSSDAESLTQALAATAHVVA